MPTITLRILLWVLFVPTLSKAQAQPAYDRMPCLLSPSTAKGFSINPQQYLWPPPIIPYEIPPSEFTTAESAQIHSAIAYLNENSNVCLLPRTFEPDYIELARSEGDFNSASSVGYRGGVHRATFAPNQTRRMYLHEFCHLFGLFHEHQRPDRDSFVTVLFDNIPQIYWPQFERYPADTTAYYWSRDYDFRSVMHYAENAFGRGGQTTIAPRDSGTVIPLEDILSETDLAALDRLYPQATDCDSIYRAQLLDGAIEFVGVANEVCRNRLVEVRFAPTAGNPSEWEFFWEVAGGEVVHAAGPRAFLRLSDLRAQRVRVRIERGVYARTYEDFIFVVDPAPDLQVLGNPVTDGRIEYRFTSTRDRVTILLTDAAGRRVFSDTIAVAECGAEGSIDCGNCPSGIYLLTVVDGRERRAQRVRIE